MHEYQATIRWTGNEGAGTQTYKGYSRNHEIVFPGIAPIFGSSDPSFRGDPGRMNPEQALLSAVSTCHMLWFLHLGMEAGLVVEAYEDQARAEMAMNPDGSGRFTQAMLRPHVTISAGDTSVADEVHHKAHEVCFIARSVNFPIHCQGTIEKR
ncbi:MAG: OsmC family protein [Pseudomonadota bacterium]